MIDDKPTKRHGLTLSMRTPTARAIEEYIVDWTYGSKAERTVGTPEPTEVERALARAIDLGMKIGKTRAQLLLPDQRDLLEDFKRQLRVLAQGLHPWQGKPFISTLADALNRLAKDVESFQSRSIVDKMVDAFPEGKKP